MNSESKEGRDGAGPVVEVDGGTGPVRPQVLVGKHKQARRFVEPWPVEAESRLRWVSAARANAAPEGTQAKRKSAAIGVGMTEQGPSEGRELK